MQELRTANDYNNVLIYKNIETEKFDAKEEVYDPYEPAGYQTQHYTVATGFETREQAEDWLVEKRKEQQINEMYETNDLVSPL